MSTPPLIDEINHARADFLVVALGAKRGQTWIEHNLARLNVPVISHLGAVVNFVAGTITRAPPKVGGLGLEWLWRIKEEPALWRRYFGDGRAFLKLLLTHVLPGALAARRFRASLGRQPAGVIAVSHESNRCRIALSGAWHERNLQPLRDALAAATQSACHVTLDLKQVDGMDGAAVGMLVLLYGHQSKNRLGFVIAALSPALHRTLRLSCADYLLRPMIAEGERPQADLVQSINS